MGYLIRVGILQGCLAVAKVIVTLTIIALKGYIVFIEVVTQQSQDVLVVFLETKNYDYCVPKDPNAFYLDTKGGNPKEILGRCEGDCDYDYHCAAGLKCFQRSGYTTVPGCVGEGKKSYDYCVPENS